MNSTELQTLAEATAAAMFATDKTSINQGIKLLSITPGSASMSMTVRPDQANGHGMCHGGFIFLLADSCFAFSCNSHNQKAVAAGASIEFLNAAQVGDVLLADGREVTRAERSGHYEVLVTRASDGVLIALFRGRSATIKGTLV